MFRAAYRAGSEEEVTLAAQPSTYFPVSEAGSNCIFCIEAPGGIWGCAQCLAHGGHLLRQNPMGLLTASPTCFPWAALGFTTTPTPAETTGDLCEVLCPLQRWASN